MISPLFRPHSSSVTASRRRQLIDYGMIATGDHEHQRFAARSTTPGGSCASQATGGSPHHLSALVRDDLFSIVLPVIARLRSSRGNLPVRSTRFVHAVGAVLCAARFSAFFPHCGVPLIRQPIRAATFPPGGRFWRGNRSSGHRDPSSIVNCQLSIVHCPLPIASLGGIFLLDKYWILVYDILRLAEANRYCTPSVSEG